MRDDLIRLVPIIKKLADEYADAYVSLDDYFTQALKIQPEPKYYSLDGVHPNANGAVFIGEIYADTVISLINGTK